ncbi:hypothetical protein NQT74_05810 [Alteromonas stellipolaris]|uniref:McrB family protein n=1 Tax=Alteromonas stellipolaris TaxID=233316 RepID=UPI00211805CE|nr:hypothetical protein [Alteromonas stellipolaris]MCQ8848087.1 hypothetical protein [Alteromonas stellipolaris]
MNFQEYCELTQDIQKIKAEKTLLFTFTNSKDEEFSISPEKIHSFLIFSVDNYSQIYDAWKNTPSKKADIHQYEEKSYRAIYKTASSADLKIISSTGSSQTKALTLLISKLLGFLTNSEYSTPEENSFFRKDYIAQALKNWERLDAPLEKKVSNPNRGNIKELFRQWLLAKGLKPRSANSYSETAIKYNDKYLAEIGIQESSLYELGPDEVLSALEALSGIDSWANADKTGKGMYTAACKQLAEFLAKNTYNTFIHLPKPFLLLAGISGTGKTRFVREQARYGAYKLVAVRPDWHEPGDLLGYETRLTESGNPEYVSTEVLKFIAAAWKELVDNGFDFEACERDGINSIHVSGEQGALSSVRAHWLCLDEMNLAPVEQYFSDYLSVLETRKWHKDDSSFTYSCDTLLDSGKLNVGGTKLRKDLGLEGLEFDELWELFLKIGLPVPLNLIVAGTVNMDETTHGFSRKVIDRAISFDFGEFFPNDFDAFFDDEEAQKKHPVKLSFPLSSHTGAATGAAKDSRTFLKAVNEVLKGSPFELAFRALNELLLTVESFDGVESDRIKLQAVWDDFLMMKLLPRIEGDADKVDAILNSLEGVLSEQLSDIWNGEKVRPDLWREPEENIACRSKRKIELMKEKLSGGFTSFWP